MTKAQLFSRVATKISTTRAAAERMVGAVFSAIADALAREEPVAIAGFGLIHTFEKQSLSRVFDVRMPTHPADGTDFLNHVLSPAETKSRTLLLGLYAPAVAPHELRSDTAEEVVVPFRELRIIYSISCPIRISRVPIPDIPREYRGARHSSSSVRVQKKRRQRLAPDESTELLLLSVNGHVIVWL